MGESDMSLGGGNVDKIRIWCEKDNVPLEGLDPEGDSPFCYKVHGEPGMWQVDLSNMGCPEENKRYTAYGNNDLADELEDEWICSDSWTVTLVTPSGDVDIQTQPGAAN
jgi:hypothetical protein